MANAIKFTTENLLLNSNGFENTNWIKNNVTITANQTISPSGLNDADLMDDGISSSTQHCIYQNPTLLYNTTYTLSIFAKYINGRYMSLHIFNGVTSQYVDYDILNGVIFGSTGDVTASIQNFGNGWFRLIYTRTTSSTGTPNIRISMADDSGSETYTGSNKQVYIYYAQLEKSSFETIINDIQSNWIKVQNFIVGVNKGGYGPTNRTNFYNGKTPNVGGYTVYISGGTASPSIFMASTDSGLISLSNRLGASNLSTTAEALNFFNDSSTMMCTNRDYPNIITSGLVLNLDATYTPSYPKNGTLWKDLSSFGNNGTLVNGSSFSSEDGGSIGFNGSNHYVSTSLQDLDRPCTFSIWVNLSSLSSFQTFFGQDTSEAITRGRFYFQKTGITGEGLIQNVVNFSIVLSNGSIVSVNASNPIQTNVWYNYSAVLTTTTISLYENGILQNTVNDSNVFLTPNTAIILNAGYYDNTVVDYINGKSSSFLIYNRALSAQEVLQNYNAALQRFLTTDGMKLYLDGDNTDKQVATASIAYDISGNNNNGTLNNGVALVSEGQRAFSFDGTNDFITLSATPSSLGMIGGSFSVNAWIYNPTNQFVGRTPILSSYSNVSPGGQYTFLLLGEGIQVSFCNSTFTEADNIVYTTIGNFWIMLTHTYDFTTKISKIYQDGLLINTFLMSTDLTANGNLLLGSFKVFSSDYYYRGYIGQTRIYNRELQATEISKIFDATKTRYNPILTANLIQNSLRTRVKIDSGLFSYNNNSLSLVIDGVRNPGLFNKASFVLSANAYKEGKLYAALPTNGNGDMTFVRGTSGLSFGTTENISRRIVDSPNNLLKFSEQFDDSSWTKTNATIIPNVIFAPNYTKTGSKLVESATNTTHSISQGFSDTNGAYTEKIFHVQFYVKAAERNFCYFTFTGVSWGSGNAGFIVNLTNGSKSQDNTSDGVSIFNVGNGWYKVNTYRLATGITLGIGVEIGSALNSLTKSYLGDGTSGIYIWGLQLSSHGVSEYEKTTTRYNVPRFDFDIFSSYLNILLEPQRTNLRTFSEVILTANSYSALNSSLGHYVSGSLTPIGGDYTSLFSLNTGANTGNNTDGFTFGTGISLSNSVQYTQSLFVKYYQFSNQKIFRIRDNVIGGTHDFILSGTGSVPSITGSLQAATITAYSDNWYRVSWTFTATGTIPGNRGDFWTLKSNQAGEPSIFVWGAQLEQGAYATSYIPTTSTALTRNGDMAFLDNIYTNSLITAVGGTWFVDLENNFVYTRDTFGFFGIQSSSSSTFDGFVIKGTGTGRLSINKRRDNVESTLYTTLTDKIKVVIRWNTTAVDVFVNGTKIVISEPNRAITTNVMNYMSLGAQDQPKYLKSTMLFATPLSDTECINLTSADIYSLFPYDCSGNSTTVYSFSSVFIPGILVYTDSALQFPYTSGVPVGEATGKYYVINGLVDSLDYGCPC